MLQRFYPFFVLPLLLSSLLMSFASAQVRPSAPAQAPFPQLNAEQQKRVDQILAVWEASAKGIARLQASFDKYQQIPSAFAPMTKYTGQLFFQAANKVSQTPTYGTIMVQPIEDAEKLNVAASERWNGYWAKANPAIKAEAAKQAKATGQPEKQIFTQLHGQARGKISSEVVFYGTEPQKVVILGRQLYHYDYDSKNVVHQVLPQSFQAGVGDGQILLFAFKMEAAQLKERFWIRETMPATGNKKNQYWIEIWPKKGTDRAEMRMAQIVLVFENNTMTVDSARIFKTDGSGLHNCTQESYIFTQKTLNPQWAANSSPFAVTMPSKEWKIFDQVARMPQAQRSARRPAPTAGPIR